MEQRRYTIRPANKVFMIWLLIILILFAGITSYISYAVQKDSIMLQCKNVMQDIYDLYSKKVYGFSDVYLPIFRSDTKKGYLRSYFEREGKELLSAQERANLVSLLKEMIQQDEDIVFIALHNPKAEHNYCMAVNSTYLVDFRPDIPLGDDTDTARMRLLGRYEWKDDSSSVQDTFLIRGGVLAGSENGCILVGYRTDIFDRVVERKEAKTLAAFLLINGNSVIYDSEGSRYTENYQMDWLGSGAGLKPAPDGKHWFTGVIRNESRDFTAAYLCPWWDVVKRSNRQTPGILLILVCFAVLALLLYLYTTRKIFRKVGQIQEGLTIIGDNRLDYRLHISDKNDEFDEISNNINLMTDRLKDSIENEYQMRVRQKWSELNQIQARFNPHFLYNTLEVIRGNLFRNGDIENADYIEKLSRIFRNLTDAEPVMTIREEISFCSLYMALLQLRYHDAVEIAFDIAPEIQDCGILSHLIQPAIENYFMHAMSEEADYHEMEISCEPVSDQCIRFVIADNGNGLSPEQLEEINQRLRYPAMNEKGYGLTSIAKRIRLFYGEEYGIILENNQPCGIRVVITMARMSMEEHRKKLGIDGI